MGRDRIEEMARAGHRAYVAAAVARGETPGTNPSMVPWDELPEDLRAANRAQAEDVPAKLAAIGCEIGPTGPGSQEFTFTDDEVEVLAHREHERWMADRRQHGWTYAPVRDDARKLHDNLVSWDQLSEVDREKDRTVVRAIVIPGFLGDGLRVVRRSTS